MTIIDEISFENSDPPLGLTIPQQAMWWLKKGKFTKGSEWEMAHSLCQQSEGTREYDLAHALTHWIEGDEDNTAYWYRRVDRRRASTISDEWNQIAALLS